MVLEGNLLEIVNLYYYFRKTVNTGFIFFLVSRWIMIYIPTFLAPSHYAIAKNFIKNIIFRHGHVSVQQYKENV